MTAIICSIAS